MIITHLYSRDISRKVKAFYRVRGNEGIPLGIPPYGYVRDPERKGFWKPEPEAAEVVRTIFEMAAEGFGVTHIAEELERRKILKPSAYRAKYGVLVGGRSLKAGSEDVFKWGMQAVSKILDRREYVGDVINFKSHQKSLKVKKRIENALEDWAVFEDVHEAIVSRELFERIQKMRKVKTRRRKNESGEVSIFSGLLRCSDCGANLNYHTNPLNRSIRYYNCKNNNNVRKTCDKTHYVRVDFLESVLLREIRRLIWFAAHREAEFETMITGAANATNERELTRCLRELSASKSRTREIDALFERLYEDNVSGKVSDERYAKQSERYDAEQRGIVLRIRELDEEIASRRTAAETSRDFAAIVKRYTRARKLSAPLLNELVDHIDVHHQEVVDGVRTQKLTIHYRCIGELNVPEAPPEAEFEMETRRGVVTRYAG